MSKVTVHWMAENAIRTFCRHHDLKAVFSIYGRVQQYKNYGDRNARFADTVHVKRQGRVLFEVHLVKLDTWIAAKWHKSERAWMNDDKTDEKAANRFNATLPGLLSMGVKTYKSPAAAVKAQIEAIIKSEANA
jgi:hypothetical protein